MTSPNSKPSMPHKNPDRPVPNASRPWDVNKSSVVGHSSPIKPAEHINPGEFSFKEGGITFDMKRKVNSLAFRKKIGLELGVPFDSDQVRNVVKGIQSKLDKFGTVVDEAEIRSLNTDAAKHKAYWEQIHAREEEMKDQIITPEEKIKRNEHHVQKDLIKHLFGF